jgi:Ca2+-binding RTX toxin-like protein
VEVNLRIGRGGPVGQDPDYISGVFMLVGSEFNDFVFGARDHANRLIGRGGNDFLGGNSYADVLNGDEGNDILDGSGGADTISGGPGDDVLEAGDIVLDPNDTVSYHDATGPVHVDLASGVATGEGTDTLSDFSNVLGSPFDDVLQGNESANTIQGETGADSISGRGGADTLLGNAFACEHNPGCMDGNDTILGGAGDDQLYGNSDLYNCDATCPRDADTLVGGPGSDLAAGGLGDDTLDVQDGVGGNDTADGGDGVDSCSFDPGDILLSCP